MRGATEGGKTASKVVNPDEIDIDMDVDDENGEENDNDSEGGEIEEGNKYLIRVFCYDINICFTKNYFLNMLFILLDVPIEKQIIPSQVFGGLKNDDD